MSIWELANFSAWALAGLMLFFMIRDFVEVERSRKEEKRKEAIRDV